MKFGASLAKYLKSGDILCLFGDLGSGKTTLVKGIAKGLRIKEDKVTSPTFVLMNIYQGKLPLFHFDFYRLEGAAEIVPTGYEEFLYGEGVSVVEWADRFDQLMPKENLEVRLTHKAETERVIRLAGKGKRYETLIHRYLDKKS